VFTYYLLKKYNTFGYNSTGQMFLPESTLKYIADNKEKDLAAAATANH